MFSFFRKKRNTKFEANGIDLVFENNELWGTDDISACSYDYSSIKKTKHKKESLFVDVNKEAVEELQQKLQYQKELIENTSKDFSWDLKQQIKEQEDWEKQKPLFEIFSSSKNEYLTSVEDGDIDIERATIYSYESEDDKYVEGLEEKEAAATAEAEVVSSGPRDYLSEDESEEILVNDVVISQGDRDIDDFEDVEKHDAIDPSDNEALKNYEIDLAAREKRIDEQNAAIEQGVDFIVDQQDLVNFKSKKLTLASSLMVEELKKKHIIFYNLLARIQETHAPNDFVSAYHIQDRISYLLNNPTLLYKSLVKQLIPYIEKINSKLQAYYNEITIKQQDIKKLNDQITRFKEYAKKTEANIEELKEEQSFLKEDIDKYQSQKQDL